jgi:LacI family transcriptional regulator
LPPTLSDIAKDAQTSVSTVSRVLSGGNAARRISAPTRERVLDSARRLGYRPNLLARSLRTRKSNTVALLVSDISNPWFGALANLIEQQLHSHGYSLILCNSGEDPEREKEYLQLLPQKGIDGLIVVPLLRSRKQLEEFLPSSLPTVILDRPLPGHDAWVAADQNEIANMLCDTLERAGVKTIATVCGPTHVITHRRRCEIASSRFKVLASHVGPALRETGRQAFIKFLGVNPDAIVATNNFLGMGILESIEKIDRPPILGVFDDVPMSHLLPIPVVCVNQDVPVMADGAVRQLLSLLEGNTEAKPIVVPCRVITNRAFQDLVESHSRAGAAG